MKTPIYLKMDASEQLLLSGVCQPLGFISYHPEVKPRKAIKVEPSERSVLCLR